MQALSPADEQLVSGWLQYWVGQDCRAFAAWDALTTLATEDFERAWPLILALAANVPEEHLGAVGAGPLENLLNAFTDRAGERAASEAHRNPRFRAALANVWLQRDVMSPPVREALILATGGKLTFLDEAQGA